MSDIIQYQDTVKENEDLEYYEVTRVHSDGRVTTARCGFFETATPEKFLDMMLSRHLAGTGKKRERVGDISRFIRKTKVARKKTARKTAKKKTAKRRR